MSPQGTIPVQGVSQSPPNNARPSTLQGQSDPRRRISISNGCRGSHPIRLALLTARFEVIRMGRYRSKAAALASAPGAVRIADIVARELHRRRTKSRHPGWGGARRKAVAS